MGKLLRHDIEILDTTLRDGSQGEDVSFSVDDKLSIARLLDDLGVRFIEGGWPAPGNAKDQAFFHRARRLKFKNSQLVAFGSTCRVKAKAASDPFLKALLMAETKTICIFGKSSDLHVKNVLRTSLDENLRMIHDSVAFFKQAKRTLIYDAEHFFDGYKRNPSYALKSLQAAFDAGADRLVLCDTNGGCLPWEIERMTRDVTKSFPDSVIGIHAHNDGDLAVANSLSAVAQGARHVQGTMNGLGERCGNANLVSIIPDLTFKMGLSAVPAGSLSRLTALAREVASIANLPLGDHQPFAGASAFAHKAGVHIDAMLKDPRSYEHLEPEKVGNERRLLASEQAGKATMLAKAKHYGIRLNHGIESAREIIAKIKELEVQGYQFEGADASLELMMRRHLGQAKPYFRLESYHVSVEHHDGLDPAEATIKLVVRGKEQHTVAEGNGPVNALDQALRNALIPFYPSLKKTQLVDYKVRVLKSSGGTAGKVRVLIQTSDGKTTWNTMGVHENIIEASWEALVDSVEHKLHRERVKP